LLHLIVFVKRNVSKKIPLSFQGEGDFFRYVSLDKYY